MTDLMRLLYDFVLDTRLDAYLETEAYAVASRTGARLEKELRAALSPWQRVLFIAYQEAEGRRGLLDLEALFQATCALVGELPG